MNKNYLGSPPLPIQPPTDQGNLMDPSERYLHDPLSIPFNLKHLPIANITRIMKESLKPKAKVSKSAKETVQECVSEFISFITSEAAQRSKMEKRKTVNGEDILTSLEVLGFEKYAEILRLYLTKYRNAWEMLDKEVNELIIDDSKMNAPPSEMDMSDIGGGMSMIASTTKKKGETDDMSVV